MHTDDLRHHERTTRLLRAALALWVFFGAVGLVTVTWLVMRALGWGE